MASDKKKAFLVYCDSKEHIGLLDDEQCGKLFRALIEYADSGVSAKLDGMAMMAFSFMKLQMDRDNQKYEEQCAKNQRNGAKGGRPRKHRDAQDDTISLEEGCKAEKNFVPEKTQRFFEKPKKPDTDTETKTETETVTDTVTDTATDTDTDTATLPAISAPSENSTSPKDCAPTLSSCEEMRSAGIEMRSGGSKENLEEVASQPQKAPPCPFKEIMELYNSICLSFPKIREISDKRRRALGILWKIHPDLSEFSEAFKRAEGSSFLKSKGWADFDWLINRKYFTRLIEGRYDNSFDIGYDGKNVLPASFDTQAQRSFNLDDWDRETLGI